jgi:hypothetical protein
VLNELISLTKIAITFNLKLDNMQNKSCDVITRTVIHGIKLRKSDNESF